MHMRRVTTEDKQRVKMRADEFKNFRRDYLFSQGHLATAIRCSRRTISAIEAGTVIFPHVGVLKRFRELRQKYERAAALRTQAVA
jgi:predicted transcriptional regulator